MLSPKAPLEAFEPKSSYKMKTKDDKLRTIDVHFALPDIVANTKPQDPLLPSVDLDRYLNRVLQTKEGISLLKQKMSRKPLDIGQDPTFRDPQFGIGLQSSIRDHQYQRSTARSNILSKARFKERSALDETTKYDHLLKSSEKPLVL